MPTVRGGSAAPLLERRWYDVTAELGLDGTMVVKQVPHAPLGDGGEARAEVTTAPAGAPEIFLAALPPTGEEPASAHYNGKLEHPAVRRPAPSNATLAAWDFSIGIPTQFA